MHQPLTPNQWHRFIEEAKRLEPDPEIDHRVYNQDGVAYWISRGRTPEEAAREMLQPLSAGSVRD